MLEFLAHQVQLLMVCSDSTLIANAIEDVLREVGVIGWLMRLASEDFECKGHLISNGDRILLSPLSVSLDESFF